MAGANRCQNSMLTCLTVSNRNPSILNSRIQYSEDLDHTLDDFRILGKQIVKPEEVTILRVLSGKGAFATIVVVNRIIEPRWHLNVFFLFGHVRRIRPARVGQFGEVFLCLDRVTLKSLVDRRTIHTTHGGVGVLGFAPVGVRAARSFLFIALGRRLVDLPGP